MRNYTVPVILACLMAGCTILPGMQNLNVSSLKTQSSNDDVRVEPVVIPLSASYIMQHPTILHEYRVSSQDVLSIMILNHPELNAPTQPQDNNQNLSNPSMGAAGYLVNQNGDIYVPLIGNIHVSGKTLEEVRLHLTKKLSVYLRHPEIFVRVADYRSKRVYIMGEVLKPGFLILNDQSLSITRAIVMAGSIDPNASDPRHIYVIRGEVTKPTIYWLDAHTPAAFLLGEKFSLQNNDVLVVSTSPVTRWSRFINQLLPSVETVWYTKTITARS